MTRPRFLRQLDSEHTPYRYLNVDSSLNERAQRAIQTYRDRVHWSRRRINKLHAEALKLNATFDRELLQSEVELAEDRAGWPR